MFDFTVTKKHYTTPVEVWNNSLQYHQQKVVEETIFLRQCYLPKIKLHLEYLASLDRYITDYIPTFCINAKKYCPKAEITSLEHSCRELKEVYQQRIPKIKGLDLMH